MTFNPIPPGISLSFDARGAPVAGLFPGLIGAALYPRNQDFWRCLALSVNKQGRPWSAGN